MIFFHLNFFPFFQRLTKNFSFSFSFSRSLSLTPLSHRLPRHGNQRDLCPQRPPPGGLRALQDVHLAQAHRARAVTGRPSDGRGAVGRPRERAARVRVDGDEVDGGARRRAGAAGDLAAGPQGRWGGREGQGRRGAAARGGAEAGARAEGAAAGGQRRRRQKRRRCRCSFCCPARSFLRSLCSSSSSSHSHSHHPALVHHRDQDRRLPPPAPQGRDARHGLRRPLLLPSLVHRARRQQAVRRAEAAGEEAGQAAAVRAGRGAGCLQRSDGDDRAGEEVFFFFF